MDLDLLITFDFANVASESVSGVQVYKTSDASVTSGGIGATINLTTNRPLNSPGIKASFGVKAVDDQSTDEGSITPEVSGLYSQTFGDDKFGISISGSYQDRESGMQQFIQDQGYKYRVGRCTCRRRGRSKQTYIRYLFKPATTTLCV